LKPNFLYFYLFFSLCTLNVWRKWQGDCVWPSLGKCELHFGQLQIAFRNHCRCHFVKHFSNYTSSHALGSSPKSKNNYENQNSISKLLKPKSKKSYNFFASCYRRVNFFNLINTVRMRNFCGFKRQLLLWVSVCIFGGMSAVRAAKEAKNLIKTLHKWNSNWVLHAKWIIEWTMAVD